MVKIGYNHTKTSTTGTNQHDVAATATLANAETAQTQLVQDGATQRNATTETNLTQRNNDNRRGRAWTAGLIAVPSALAVGITGAVAASVINNGTNAQATADAARTQAEASRVTVETGDRNMCNMVVIATDKAGNQTVLNLGQGNPNDPHLTGDAIAQLIKDGKATGTNVKVGNTNEATAIISLDYTGKVVSKVVPAACDQDAGSVFNGPKA